MTFDNSRYWIELSEYDLETAEAMFATKRWLYVGFMCHQTIEKSLKAYWCAACEGEPPYIHNLIRLAEGCGLDKEMSDTQNDFIAQIMPLNIEARYPLYKEELSRRMTEIYCRRIIDNTRELQIWIKNRLSAL